MENSKNIELILKDNMMDFSAYANLNRAIPDIRDGLKPVHRRILYTMHKMKATKFTKSANVSGEVMKIHPHGDSYDSIVNLCQVDRNPIPLLVGKGNFSSCSSRDLQYGASRYTEVKLSDIAIDILSGLNDKIVEFVLNYDGSMMMPEVLPVHFPVILTNFNSGIGVGLAASLPSFNLVEIYEAMRQYINTGEKTNLIPDFGTGGYVINSFKDISNINNNGIGKITIRGKATIEGNTISITEVPYTTTREDIVDKVIDLIKEGKIKEILDIKDLTGLHGMNIEITCKKNTDMDLLLNKLYKMTPLETTYTSNMNLLCFGLPKVMGVWDIIDNWLDWRMDCLKKSYKHEVKELKIKLHLYDGLIKIIDFIDEIIDIIRKSDEDKIISNMCDKFNLTKEQAEYIADIKIRNLNKSHINKTIKNKEDLENRIDYLLKIINDNVELKQIIISQIKEVSKKYGKPRMTQIIDESEVATTITKDDLIQDYNCRILYTKQGYIKKHLKLSDNHKIKEDDTILGDITSTNKSTLLIFTNKSNRYKLPVHELETVTPSSYGTFAKNIIELEQDEEIIKIVSVEKEIGYMCFIYNNGKLAKVDIKSFMSANKKLQNCYNTDSELIAAEYIEKDVDCLFVSSEGKALIMNSEKSSSKSSRNSQGNTAIKLADGFTCIGGYINIDPSYNFKLETSKGKSKEFMLDDIAPTNKPNEERNLFRYLCGNNSTSGNFLINTRNNNDLVTKFEIIQ